MINRFINNFKFNKIKYEKLFFIIFILGSFLLFSAPAISSFFLLLALVYGLAFRKNYFFADKFNIVLISVSCLMILSCFLFPFTDTSNLNSSNLVDFTNPYLGLINWIPLFLCFWGFQSFLDSEKKREIVAISLVCGTFPLLFSGFTQYFLNWHGPYQLFNGLVIWYQRFNSGGRMTSVFNNPNYAGCLFAAIWPFFFATLRQKNLKIQGQILLLVFNFLVFYAVLLTASRNSFFALIISFLILYIPFNFKFIISLISSLLLISIISKFLNIIFEIRYFPNFLFEKLHYENLYNDPRLLLWKTSLKYILEKPLLGWGGNNFAYIWNQTNFDYFGHSHSIPLELTIQYGIVASIALCAMILFLLIKSFKKLFLKENLKFKNYSDKNNFDIAWFAASVSIIFSNLIDIQYFDLRISLVVWILLAGLKQLSYKKS